MLRQVYEGLVSLDDNAAPIPMIAESWEISDDGLVYDFYIRDDIKFHNGQDLTAADVAYSLQYWKDEALRSTLLVNVESIDVVDEYTVRVTLSEPEGDFLVVIGNPRPMPIVPAGSADGGEQARTPIGSGPFRLVEFSNEDLAVMERFDAYTPVDHEKTYFGGAKEVLIDRLEFHSVPDHQTALAGFRTGQYDIMTEVQPEQADQVRGMGNAELYEEITTSAAALYVNMGENGIQDLNLRKAISAAIDKQQLVDVTEGGHGVATNSYTPEGLAWHTPTSEYWPYDGGVEQARQLLADSDYNGEPVEILASSFEYMQSNAVLLQQQLAAAGIETTIRQMDHTSYLDTLNASQFQIAASGRPLRIPASEEWVRNYCAFGEITTRFGVCDEEYDLLYEEAISTTEDEARYEAYAQLEKILKDLAIEVPLYFRGQMFAVSNEVEGFRTSPFEWLDFSNVSVSR